MKSAFDFVSNPKSIPTQYYGIDTETYIDNQEYGLKSIQIYGENQEMYITAETFDDTERNIRMSICKQFVNWIDSLKANSIFAFFNINFDASQFMYYIVCQSEYEYVNNETKYNVIKKGQIQILESDKTIYKIVMRNLNGALITMMDIGNFLTGGATLNQACKEWINDSKVDIESKDFPKRFATDIERQYAMKDAELTYRLFLKLNEEGVIERNKYVTIASRTMGHYKEYLKKFYGLTFWQFTYRESDKELIKEMQDEFETWLRKSYRGGICQAVHIGEFTGCHHIDARSMYPSQMVKPQIPTGPILDEPPEGSFITIVFPIAYLQLKDKKIPYLQWQSRDQCIKYSYIHQFEPGQFVTDCFLDGTYALWGPEWDWVNECYDVTLKGYRTIKYIAMRDNVVLKRYVEMLYKGKRENKGTKRYYYKILLNALYGKFATAPDGDIIDYSDGERKKIESTKNVYYLPLGSWITMGGRLDLCKAMASIPYDDVLYCDTDSIIFKGDVWPSVTIGENLREWGVEHELLDCVIVGPKTYQELLPDGTLITKCAGMPKTVQASIPYRGLHYGLVVPVLKSKRDKESWAIHLEKTTFEISEKTTVFRGRK